MVGNGRQGVEGNRGSEGGNTRHVYEKGSKIHMIIIIKFIMCEAQCYMFYLHYVE